MFGGNITGKKKIFRIVILVMAIAVLIACTAYFIADYFHYRSIINIGNVSSTTENSSVDKVKKEVNVPVDFYQLKGVNEDIYAWIRIPYVNQEGEYIADYPVLQSNGNDDMDYYLDHNVNRQSSVYGSIYTQSYNSKDFNDYNTVVYGHNMRNGTMFGSLKKFRNQDFFNENNVIEVYIPNRILKYRIFAAYVYDNSHILVSYDFSNETERQSYLNSVFSNRKLTANFDDTVTVGTNDKIITLSTCTSNDNERYLVQGVLVYDSEIDD